MEVLTWNWLPFATGPDAKHGAPNTLNIDEAAIPAARYRSSDARIFDPIGAPHHTRPRLRAPDPGPPDAPPRPKPVHPHPRPGDARGAIVSSDRGVGRRSG